MVGLGSAGVAKGRVGSKHMKVTFSIGALSKARRPVENTRTTNAAN